MARETLGFRRVGFSPTFSLLMPTSSLPCAPLTLSIQLRRTGNAPLPIYININPIASAHDLSPVKFSVQARSTSELLRYL